MTVDRCHFIIKMYRGSSHRLPHGVGIVNFRHGVVVECMRISGSVLSFHRACRAILQSAMGQSAGNDRRKSYTTSVLEFRRLKKTQQKQERRDSDKENRDSSVTNRSSEKAAMGAAHSLEQALKLIRKDRLECQQLGLEQLVGLTNVETCGKEIAIFTSLQLLQNEAWLWNLLKEAQSSEPGSDETSSPSSGTPTSHNDSMDNTDDQEKLNQQATDDTEQKSGAVSESSATISSWIQKDPKHESTMRASALRVLCNVLSVLSKEKPLHEIVNRPNSPLIDRSLLDALVQDLTGAYRPPSVVLATAGGHSRLSSAHEAALAIRCLRLLGEESKACYEYMQSQPVMERLEMARACGRSTHLVLEQEAEWTYSKLTEDLRSC